MASDLNVMAALPEIVLAVAALVLLLVGVFQRRDETATITWMAVGTLALTGFLIFGRPAGSQTAFYGAFVSDGFAVFVKLLILLGAALGLVMSVDFNRRAGNARFEYPVLLLLATLGMLMMVSANDLISLYVGLELQSLALYVVAAFNRDSVRSTEAGLKYFVLGALSSGLLLYGASLVYGYVGATDFASIGQVLRARQGPPETGLVFGLVFLAAGFAFKISAVPFHMWTPDVYEGAPTPVTAFFAVAPKVAAMAMMIRVFVEPFGPIAPAWQQIVVLVAVLSMAVGAFAAIWQDNVKRLMAYSSIGHVGYALVGLAPSGAGGVQSVLIYLAIYVVMNVATFAAILAMRRDGQPVERIADLAGLAKAQPLVAAALAVAMFSMAGIPPLAGFFGKLYVFMAAVQGGYYLLAVFGVLTSVVGAFYYLRIVKLMYFDEAAAPLDRPMDAALGTVLAGTSLLTLLFFVAPAPLVAAAGRAAASLFAS